MDKYTNEYDRPDAATPGRVDRKELEMSYQISLPQFDQEGQDEARWFWCEGRDGLRRALELTELDSVDYEPLCSYDDRCPCCQGQGGWWDRITSTEHNWHVCPDCAGSGVGHWVTGDDTTGYAPEWWEPMAALVNAVPFAIGLIVPFLAAMVAAL